MASVSELKPREPVQIEAARLVALADEIGIESAGRAATASIEEIVDHLCRAEAAWQSCEFARVGESARALCGIAEELGMETLARIARETANVAGGRDPVALAALVARQSRVGEATLAAIWNLGSMRV